MSRTEADPPDFVEQASAESVDDRPPATGSANGGSPLMTSRQIVHNAASLVGTVAVTSGLGVVYWWLAAVNYDQTSVGLASAAVAAMTFLGALSTMGLGTLLIGELPIRRTEWAALASTASAVVGVLGLAVGMAFAIAAPLVSPDLTVLGDTPWVVLLFGSGVALTAVSLVLDKAVIGVFRGNLQLQRNTLFAVVKLMLLYVAGAALLDPDETTILATWVVGLLVSLIALAALAAWRAKGISALRPRREALAGSAVPALGHHAFNIALQAPSLMLPMITVAVLSAATNASFYIAAMIAGFVWMAPISLSTVLFAVGAGNEAGLRSQIRFTLRSSCIAVVGACVVVIPAADLILSAFGPDYPTEAAWTLRILTLASFPVVVKCHFVAVSRVQRRIARSMPIVVGGTMLEIGLAVAGAVIGGLNGLAIGWAVGLIVEALVMTPLVRSAASNCWVD